MRWSLVAVGVVAVAATAWGQDSRLDRGNQSDAATLKAKCDLGHALSCWRLGVLYEEGRGGVPKDLALAAPLYTRACDWGHPAACISMARMYTQGQGVKKDAGRARGRLQRAKELAEHYCLKSNDAWGCEILGGLDSGAKGARSWYALAANRYAARCNYGDGEACHALLGLDLPSKGIPWDGAGLRDMLQQACDRGIPERCIDLANMYLRGTGVEKDQGRGHDVLRQLCGQGEAPDREREFYRWVACDLVGAIELNAQQQK